MLTDKFFGETIPHNFKIINDRLSRTGSGHFGPSGFSWVDLLLISFLDYFNDKKAEMLAQFKLIQALDDKVRAMPNIAAWIAKRPKSLY